MVDYKNVELANMHLAFGAVEHDEGATQWLYAHRYSMTHTPNHKLFGCLPISVLLVYDTSIHNAYDLFASITVAAGEIQNKPGILENVRAEDVRPPS
ncbi:hypothetical protein NPIL_440311 [Nephila pilipes]|uniref:Uncharacterized protein n=1 Tax=Nephila pilipes TaxID=299642 RepID=A0A8X6NGY6_NEPPI|nr:hypothetical protein NPIL_440311 [Nephila pilipes]